MHLARMNGLSTPIPHPSASVTGLVFYHVSFGVFSPFLTMVILQIVELGGQTLETKN